MNDYLVIGAGISGCAAGVELAQAAGGKVEILEAGSAIGGKVLSYCCKATEDCSQCGVCLAHTLLGQALRHPGIRFTTGASVEAVRRQADGIIVEVRRREPGIDPRKCIACDACLAACPAGAIHRYSRAELVQYGIDYGRCLRQQGESCAACRDACPARAIDGASRPRASTSPGGPQTGCAERLTRLRADRVLVAIGHEPFDASRKIRLGYGRLPNVMTATEAEQILSRQSLPGRPGESIAFIQCVGSRDPQLGRNYCSSVCCAYALRLARMLRHRDPQAAITIYYIDLQNFDKSFTRLRAELEERGVRFVRGLPSSVQAAASGRLRLRFDDPQASGDVCVAARGSEASASDVCVAEHDRIVLSVGLGPAPEAARLAALFGLERDAYGFLRPDGGRVYVTGTCREPQPIVDSIASARAAALEMLAGGKDMPDGGKA